ncbi:fimbria/pilus periplasmic chaperone [Nevskia sp.]|uniref:fimbrial biogenesis chaperone n=1 Tax=Nevskia sp. TaxID=1929292 RepID=UPI0025F59C32|nr:fimbria/pilus periplasmic chaperone [Nevskia sp.]HET7798297.1 fimbria/pilus periplasmic chaperone [Nevskia sp.]
MTRLPIAACFLLALTTRAGSITVNPVRLEVPSDQTATSLTISNAGGGATTMQVRVFRWRHVDGADVLEPADDAAASGEAPLVTPPMFRLDGNGASQIVRIGFLHPPRAAEEGRWRVIVEEVPPPFAAVGYREDGDASQIAMRLRVSLPLFRQPEMRRSDLRWSAEGGSIAPQLVAANQGTITERIDEAQLQSDGHVLSRIAGPIYLFPGERRRFALDPASAAPVASGALQLRVDGTSALTRRDLRLSAQ